MCYGNCFIYLYASCSVVGRSEARESRKKISASAECSPVTK